MPTHAHRRPARLPRLRHPRGRGFSLVELLVALGIIAVLLALAAPSFRRHLAEAAVDSAASQMLSGLALARRIALSSGQATTLCLTRDEITCSFDGSSWMLFSNTEGGSDSRREPDETVLRRQALPRGVQAQGTRGYATYLPQPRAAATLTFTFCHNGAPQRRRSVVVSQTGRPRLARIDDNATRCA